MKRIRFAHTTRLLTFTCLILSVLGVLAQEKSTQPDKIYVPYDKLKGVFEKEGQGIFMPYRDFERLWRAAKGKPADARGIPLPYLISTARFTGTVGAKLASLNLELTIDILANDWTNVPIGLGKSAIAKAGFKSSPDTKADPLLRVVKGDYFLLVKGRGRYVLSIDFVRQLVRKPGQNVLEYRIPGATVSTLELLIPEENMKVDVEPLLAATTSQTNDKRTRLQAFLGNAGNVKLSWQPKTQAAADLTPVIICEQNQRIHVAEALITHDVKFAYDIRRRGVRSFTIQLPEQVAGMAPYRVTSVDGSDISKWEIISRKVGNRTAANLKVELFSEVKGPYALSIRMERFLKDPKLTLPIAPITTQQVLRRTGILAVTHSSRRSVEVRNANTELVRVDVGRLDRKLRRMAGVTAYRFTSNSYTASLVIGTVLPKVSIEQGWGLSIAKDMQFLTGTLKYTVGRAGVFTVRMGLDESWKITSVGPGRLVDDFELKGTGKNRTLEVTLKREVVGEFSLDISAQAARTAPNANVDFSLPRPDTKYLHQSSGTLVLSLIDALRAEVKTTSQLRSTAIKSTEAIKREGHPKVTPAMALEFRGVDSAKPAGATFAIVVKPAQVSATVHRLVNIQPGSVEHEAVIEYRVRYAPVDTFYLKFPAALADAGLQIVGKDIKERPRVASVPGDTTPPPDKDQAINATKWVYHKIVLQSPVSGQYSLKVNWRQKFRTQTQRRSNDPAQVKVHAVLAAGMLSDQNGYVAAKKDSTLAIEKESMTSLVPGDAGSALDLPHAPHRKGAIKAYRYDAPPFLLTLPVRLQKEAAVFTTIANAVVLEQALSRDGTLNARAIYLLSSSRGDRLEVTMPTGSDVYAFLLNGQEVAVEQPAPDVRVVRLPPSAGQVSKLVLEVNYGMKDAKTSALPAPRLPETVPVQRTYWRLWTPTDYRLLGHDRNYSVERLGSAKNLADTVGDGHSGAVITDFAAQGTVWGFGRQGATKELSLFLISRLWLAFWVWLVIIAAGIYAMRHSGHRRAQVVTGVVVALAFLHLYQPLLVSGVVRSATLPLLAILATWFIQYAKGRNLLKTSITFGVDKPKPPPIPESGTPGKAKKDDGAKDDKPPRDEPKETKPDPDQDNDKEG